MPHSSAECQIQRGQNPRCNVMMHSVGLQCYLLRKISTLVWPKRRERKEKKNTYLLAQLTRSIQFGTWCRICYSDTEPNLHRQKHFPNRGSFQNDWICLLPVTLCITAPKRKLPSLPTIKTKYVTYDTFTGDRQLFLLQSCECCSYPPTYLK